MSFTKGGGLGWTKSMYRRSCICTQQEPGAEEGHPASEGDEQCLLLQKDLKGYKQVSVAGTLP